MHTVMYDDGDVEVLHLWAPDQQVRKASGLCCPQWTWVAGLPSKLTS